MFGELFRSFKKSSKVKKLTKEYLKSKMSPSSNSAFEMLTADTTPRDNTINKIVDMAYNEPNSQPPIKKFKITKDKLSQFALGEIKLSKINNEIEVIGDSKKLKVLSDILDKFPEWFPIATHSKKIDED